MLLLLQLVVLLAAAKLCGALVRRIGQPAVVGEMAAGLLLGPLVFGAWWPQAHATLFPAASLPVLSGLGTLGVTLFMFIVGAELRAPEGSRRQVRAAASASRPGVLPARPRSLRMRASTGKAVTEIAAPKNRANGQ